MNRLPPDLKSKWIWWNLPSPERASKSLDQLIEEEAIGHRWHSSTETAQLLGMMSPINAEKIRGAQKKGKRAIGTVYKRTRIENGMRIQRAEVRFDGVAGCLRTPGGGSSRQSIIIVEGLQIRSRLLSIREAARLMGVHDGYLLPGSYNEGYHIFGDGLAVPVVSHIAKHLLTALVKSAGPQTKSHRRLAA